METEEGLLEAWERKILIFLQEIDCFCGVGQIVADGELQEIVSFGNRRGFVGTQNINFPAGK